MNDIEDSRLIGMLRRVIRDCGALYEQSAKWMVRRYPNLLEGREANFVELMDDLHRGLLIKVYVTVVRADDRWTGPEKKIAAAMIEHLWGEQLHGSQLREAATGLFQQADMLTWESLVAPFVRYPPLANSKDQVETITMRLANLVANCDGQPRDEEAVMLHNLQREIDMALRPAKPEETLDSLPNLNAGSATAKQHKQEQQYDITDPEYDVMPQEEREDRLQKAMTELEQLIGLTEVKSRVKSYTNFLQLQQQRRDAGLNTMPISLHMSFVGNPGTGKTTVARIVGQILGALGTLKKGHVVETDRSGLVAEYAGQTATKTNKLCDSARGGVLFIDEAYSLMDSSGDDAYGREAIQALLKRMEDDRDSMAVILAGYSDEMDQMIRTNPGLSSRINTTIEFDDYSPFDLCKIFEILCDQNQYKLPSDARYRVLVGFDQLFSQRDRHFGNGRLVRNAFEDSVRRLADRVVTEQAFSEEHLTSLTAHDISMPGITSDALQELMDAEPQLRIECNGCQRNVRLKPTALGRTVKCVKCGHVQTAKWATVQPKA